MTFERPQTYQRWVALILLLLFFALAVSATTRLSLTGDEGPQLTSAYAYLTTGDPLLIEHDGHPPFAKIWNALPLLWVPDLGSPADAPSWQSSDPISLMWVTQEFFYPYRPLDRIVIPPRIMVALLGVLLLAIIYRWAADWFGAQAGLLALFLATFDPNLLAHAGLATNDLAVTLACTATLFTCWRFLKRRTLPRMLATGVVLGLAQSAKLNAILLLPIVGLLLLIQMGLLYRTNRREQLPYFIGQTCALFAVAALTLWATYGFDLRTITALPFPLPAGSHLVLWERVLTVTSSGHPAFLMGEFSTEGWWYYFPVAFIIKTPLPTLLLLLMGIIAFIGGHRRKWVDELVVWSFVLLYSAFIIHSRLNIGYRHMLPVLPLLLIALSSRAAHFKFHTSHIPHYVLLAWLTFGTLRLAPHYLAHFNELVGGPDQGYRYLVDSNLDWGQAFKELARYQREHATGQIYLSTHIEYTDALHSYGLDFAPLPPLPAAPNIFPHRFNPTPGIYALSATTLQGIPTADPEMYDWFRQREPDAKLGHALFVYHVVEPALPASWVAQCTLPISPLPADVIREGFGRDDLRQVYFDCTQSWFLPGGGAFPGWVVLFRDTALGNDAFIQAQLAPLHKSFEQRIASFQPPFVIYQAEATLPTPTLPYSEHNDIGGLRFLGHTAHQASNAMEVWTYWQVSTPPTTPVSLMLHLLGPDDAPVSVGDGLGVSQEQWQPGDVLIQRHHLPLPLDAPAGAYTPLTGVYTLETLERYPVIVNGQATSDTLRLPPINIGP